MPISRRREGRAFDLEADGAVLTRIEKKPGIEICTRRHIFNIALAHVTCPARASARPRSDCLGGMVHSMRVEQIDGTLADTLNSWRFARPVDNKNMVPRACEKGSAQGAGRARTLDHHIQIAGNVFCQSRSPYPRP